MAGMDKEKRKKQMEEYLEDIFEENDSAMDLLDALDIESELVDAQWSGEFEQDDDYLCNQ